MEVKEFLEDLLERQELETNQEKELQEHKKEITDFLQQEFGDEPIIRYAGSYEKGTMIRDKYDLDVVCYFPSGDERTLKEIHDDVLTCLQEKYVIEEKASAVRITNIKDAESQSDYHVDVVPGRFIENSDDVFLHVVYGDKERMQTNLKKHINHITGSGCVDVIRLIKLWALRSDLGIKTFVLELFVVKSLEGFRDKSDLGASFLKSIQSFKDTFKETKLVDPANEANVVSKLVSPSIADRVEQAASAAIALIGESDEVKDWEMVFQENNTRGFSQSADRPREVAIKNPAGQWAE